MSDPCTEPAGAVPDPATVRQPFPEPLREAVRQLIFASRALNDVNRTCKRLRNRRFTLDGHIIGSLGEAIAALEFGVELEPASTRGCDGTVDGYPVQIKATQVRQANPGDSLRGRINFRGDLKSHNCRDNSAAGNSSGPVGEKELRLLVLALHLEPPQDCPDEDWEPEWECVYYGRAASVVEQTGPIAASASNGQWSRSLSVLADVQSKPES